MCFYLRLITCKDLYSFKELILLVNNSNNNNNNDNNNNN